MDVQQPDEALMLLYGEGNTGAFELLYHRHKGGVYRYIKRHAGLQLDGDALVQEVWAKVIKASSTYRVSAKFTTWLYTIAHHCIVDAVRKHRHKFEPLSDENGEDTDVLVASNAQNDNPMNNVSAKQQVDRLLEVLSALPADQRDVFLLKHEAGFSVKEIAEVIGVGEETAKTRLRYAMQKIRTSMENEGGQNNE
ncbi:MAG: sigma-70 family RNA polymerase sigma factor [Pseudomonadales bacterium]|nr:sigma-70 family RNA polymerase sigma factor [Pseudomonadales bacterium]